MGTRAWVKIPEYDLAGHGKDMTYIWGKHVGDLYVQTLHDGDVLPIDVQKVVQYMLANPKNGLVSSPEGFAAWLVGCLFQDSDLMVSPASIAIYTSEPEEGWGMVVDFKTQMVTYLSDKRRYSFRNFANRKTGIVFSA